MLHNRRVIALHGVGDVRRVPVDLRHARMLLNQARACVCVCVCVCLCVRACVSVSE